MKKPVSLFFSLIYSSLMWSQSSVPDVSGEYYLEGVRETASGFLLHKDGSFEFFFSQGALDRTGKGQYEVKADGSVIFNSDSIPEKDFRLIGSSKDRNKFTTIKITEPNTQLLQYVFVRIFSGKQMSENFADSRGYVRQEGARPDSIQLMFEFCPEKITTIVLPPGNENVFEFALEPWLFEVFFREFKLKKVDASLKGPHPMLKGDAFLFVKSGSEMSDDNNEE